MTKEDSVNQVKLAQLLNPSRILILKGRQNKKDVFTALIDIIAEEKEFGTRDDLEWGIFHREGLLSTGIGNGIAIPHVLLPNVDSICIAMALCPDGISDFQSRDSMPVQLVFMVAAGKNQTLKHMKLLGSIGSLFYDGRLKAAFLEAKDPETCIEILARAEN